MTDNLNSQNTDPSSALEEGMSTFKYFTDDEGSFWLQLGNSYAAVFHGGLGQDDPPTEPQANTVIDYMETCGANVAASQSFAEVYAEACEAMRDHTDQFDHPPETWVLPI